MIYFLIGAGEILVDGLSLYVVLSEAVEYCLLLLPCDDQSERYRYLPLSTAFTL
jgi:hypothetical protein